MSRCAAGTASRTVDLPAVFTDAVRHRICSNDPLHGVMRAPDGQRRRRLNDTEYEALARRRTGECLAGGPCGGAPFLPSRTGAGAMQLVLVRRIMIKNRGSIAFVQRRCGYCPTGHVSKEVLSFLSGTNGNHRRHLRQLRPDRAD
jgi:hypothetical protein